MTSLTYGTPWWQLWWASGSQGAKPKIPTVLVALGCIFYAKSSKLIAGVKSKRYLYDGRCGGLVHRVLFIRTSQIYR